MKKTLMKKRLNKPNYTLTAVLMVIAIFVILGPLYMALVISLKNPSDMGNVLSLPKHIQWSNFSEAWKMTDYSRMFLNTFFITIVNIIFTILTNSMAAYAITRNRKKNKFFNV
ncbi:MAG: carbohydrate ABC transporter permease, partial [Liquorilactobacillus hordei]